MAEAVGVAQRADEESPVLAPSAFQIRVAGYKGACSGDGRCLISIFVPTHAPV